MTHDWAMLCYVMSDCYRLHRYLVTRMARSTWVLGIGGSERHGLKWLVSPGWTTELNSLYEIQRLCPAQTWASIKDVAQLLVDWDGLVSCSCWQCEHILINRWFLSRSRVQLKSDLQRPYSVRGFSIFPGIWTDHIAVPACDCLRGHSQLVDRRDGKLGMSPIDSCRWDDLLSWGRAAQRWGKTSNIHNKL